MTAALACDRFSDFLGDGRGRRDGEQPDPPAESGFSQDKEGRWVSASGALALECPAEMDPFSDDRTWFVVELGPDGQPLETLSGFETRAEAEEFLRSVDAAAD